MATFQLTDSRRVNLPIESDVAAAATTDLSGRALEPPAPRIASPRQHGEQINRNNVSEFEAVMLALHACGLSSPRTESRPIIWIPFDVHHSDTPYSVPLIKSGAHEKTNSMRQPVPVYKGATVNHTSQPLQGTFRGKEEEAANLQYCVSHMFESRKPEVPDTTATWSEVDISGSLESAVNKATHLPNKAPRIRDVLRVGGLTLNSRAPAGFGQALAAANKVSETDNHRKPEGVKSREGNSDQSKGRGNAKKLTPRSLAAGSQRPAVKCFRALILAYLLVVGTLLIVAGLQQKWDEAEIKIIGDSGLGSPSHLPPTPTREPAPPGHSFGTSELVERGDIDSDSQLQEQEPETSKPTLIARD